MNINNFNLAHCPNTNSPSFRKLSSVIGQARAYIFHQMNNGLPIGEFLYAENVGQYKEYVAVHGERKAMYDWGMFMTSKFMENKGVSDVDALRAMNYATSRIEPTTNKELYYNFKAIDKKGERTIYKKETINKMVNEFNNDKKNQNKYWFESTPVGDGKYVMTIHNNPTQLLSIDLDAPNSKITVDGYTFRLDNAMEPNEAIVEHQMRSEVYRASEHFNDVLKSIERALPGVSIIRETYDTIGTRVGVRGYVSKDGIHYNMQTLHYDTPIHEATHIWIEALETFDNKKYQTLVAKAQETIDLDPTLYNIIKSKYPELNDMNLMKEYISTVSGLISADKTKEFILTAKRQNIYDDTLFGNIQEFIDKAWEYIQSVIENIWPSSSITSMNFKEMTLGDILNALSDDILAGNNIIGYGSREIGSLMNQIWKDNIIMRSKNLRTINNIADIQASIINTNDISILGGDQYSDDKVRTEAAKQVLNNLRKRKNKYYYREYGINYEFDGALSKGELMQQIKDNVIEERAIIVNSFSSNVKEIISRYHTIGNTQSIEDIVEEVYEQYSDDFKQRMAHAIKTSGANDPLVKVLNYDELKNDADYSFLYNESMAGFKPLIFIHYNDEKTIDISVMDYAIGLHSRKGYNITSNNNNIAAQFGVTDILKPFKLSNSKSDIHKAILSFQIASMKHLASTKGKKLRIRRTGAMGFSGSKITPQYILDMQMVMNDTRKLFKLEQVNALMDKTSSTYPFMQEVLNDDNAWNGNDLFSFDGIIKNYYESYKDELGLTNIEVEHLTSNPKSVAHIKILEQRQKDILKNRSLDAVKDDAEWKMLAQYLIYAKTGYNTNSASVKDINMLSLRTVNMHNQSNIAIQHFASQAEEVKSIFIDKVNGYKKDLIKLIRASMQSRNTFTVTNNPSTIFGHLYVKGKVILSEDYGEHKKGETVEVVMFNQLHGSHNIDAANKAGLTKEDIALSDFILSHVRERMADLYIHEQKKIGNEISIDEAMKYIEERMEPGTIPVLNATTNENIRKGDFLGAFRQIIDKVAKGEYLSGDQLFKDEDAQNLTSRFFSHLDYQTQIVDDLGLAMNERYSDSDIPTFDAVNMEKFENHTMNLEYLFNMVSLDTVRKIEIENRLLPVWNDVQTFIYVTENDTMNKKDYLKNTKQLLEEYFNIIVLRKNADDPNDKLATIVRNSLRATTFLSLGYRPVLWFKSGFFNEQNLMLQSLATSATEALMGNKDIFGYPSASDITKAHEMMFTDFRKIKALGEKFSIINSSELDVIESIFTTITDKTIWRNQFAQLGNYYTDICARLIVMTGFMIHDGSYDAHEYNEETETLKYDWKKDKRYTKDGKFKSDNDEVLFNHILERQKDTGLATTIDDMQVGYDFKEANERFKWYADKYVIGAMDEYQSALMGNIYAGALFTQYRKFMFDKLFNVVGSERESIYGTRRTVKDVDGQIEVVHNMINNEGWGASIYYVVRDTVKLARMKDYTMEDFKKMPPNRVRNLIIAGSQMLMWGGIFLAIKAMDLSDEDKKKVEFMYTELMPTDMYFQTYASLIPMLSNLNKIYEVVVGERRWNALLSFAGPLNTVSDTMWMVELMGKHDTLRRDMAAPSREEVREQRRISALEKQARDSQDDATKKSIEEQIEEIE